MENLLSSEFQDLVGLERDPLSSKRSSKTKGSSSSSSKNKYTNKKTTKINSEETVWEDVDYNDAEEYTAKTQAQANRKGKKIKGKKVKDVSCLSVGDTVIVRGQDVGTVLFLGDVHYSSGCFVGVNVGSSGKNDGSVKGKRYFTCPPGEGLLVKLNEVELLE